LRATLTGGTAARQVVAEGSPTRSSLIVANCHAEAVSRIVERGGNPAADGSPTRSSLTVANCHCGPGGGVEGDVEPPTVFKFSTVTVAVALGLSCCVWREVFGKRGGVKGGLPPVFESAGRQPRLARGSRAGGPRFRSVVRDAEARGARLLSRGATGAADTGSEKKGSLLEEEELPPVFYKCRSGSAWAAAGFLQVPVRQRSLFEEERFMVRSAAAGKVRRVLLIRSAWIQRRRGCSAFLGPTCEIRDARRAEALWSCAGRRAALLGWSRRRGPRSSWAPRNVGASATAGAGGEDASSSSSGKRWRLLSRLLRSVSTACTWRSVSSVSYWRSQ